MDVGNDHDNIPGFSPYLILGENEFIFTYANLAGIYSKELAIFTLVDDGI
jgi:hypothetical protein